MGESLNQQRDISDKSQSTSHRYISHMLRPLSHMPIVPPPYILCASLRRAAVMVVIIIIQRSLTVRPLRSSPWSSSRRRRRLRAAYQQAASQPAIRSTYQIDRPTDDQVYERTAQQVVIESIQKQFLTALPKYRSLEHAERAKNHCRGLV